MATSDKLNKLLSTKAAIKQAIIDKGVEVADSEPFANYPNKIAEITGGGSGNNEELTGSYIIARFENCEEGNNFIKKATELDVSHFDVSNMRNTNEMFNRYENITSLDLSSWDVSNVEEMVGMFDSSSITTFGDISNWNTSSLRRTRSMFGSCRSLTSLDLSNWNTDSLEDMYNMFASCENLEVLNLSNWNLNNDMERSFYGCSSLHTIRLDNCNGDTINKVISSSEFPTNTISGVTRKIYVNPDNIGDLTAPDGWEFVDCNTGEVIAPEEEIPLYQPDMFSGSTDIEEVSVMVTSEHDDLNGMFSGCKNLRTINGINRWNTSNVRNMSGMFSYCGSLESLDLSSFNTSNVGDMRNMFFKCANLKELNLSSFEIREDCETRWMFQGCNKLHTLRLDDCDKETIRKIIESREFPTGEAEDYEGTRQIFVKVDVSDLTEPDGWDFVNAE